jgi:hypothetical protein
MGFIRVKSYEMVVKKKTINVANTKMGMLTNMALFLASTNP